MENKTTITTNIKGFNLNFYTNGNLFSPKSIDLGTMTMLNNVEIKKDDKVLDLGCGYGVVGIYAGKIIGNEKVHMVDIDDQAVNISKENIKLNGLDIKNIYKSNGLDEVSDYDFTLILSNPPYHTDFSVGKNYIEKGFKHLMIGGKLVLVVKRLKWYENKMRAIFGGVKVINENDYYVLISEKRLKDNAPKKKKQPTKKHLKKMARVKKKRFSL